MSGWPIVFILLQPIGSSIARPFGGQVVRGTMSTRIMRLPSPRLVKPKGKTSVTLNLPGAGRVKVLFGGRG